jgi:hypothetical protein
MHPSINLTLAGLCIIIQLKQINRPDATVLQAYYLSSVFKNFFSRTTVTIKDSRLLLDVLCRSACFGRLHAHHRELTTALTTSGFTLERGGSSVVIRGLAGRPDNNAATTALQRKTRGC